MSGIGKKRAAEDRLDRDEIESGSAAPAAAAPAATSTPAAPIVPLSVKAGARAEDAPSANPFKGLATSTASVPVTGGFAGFGAAASSAPTFSGFGGFGAAAAPAASTGAAPLKFSFSFGAPAAAAAAPAPAADATPAAPAAATTTPPATTFSFGSTAAPAAGATTFSFGQKFDFGAGVKAFAAAQTAAATAEKKPAAADAEEEAVDPEAEDPAAVAAAAARKQTNALASAAVKTDVTAGDENDEVELEVPNTKVFLLGFKETVGEDGKSAPTTEREWKERGVGTLKVSTFAAPDGATRHRLLMHSTQTKQVVVNVTVDKWFAVAAVTDKAVNFRTVVVEDGKPKPAMYSLRVAETAVQSLAEKLKAIAPKKE